jgi:diadenosine tetraphosphate (Ap4A) HIT family hydrolase
MFRVAAGRAPASARRSPPVTFPPPRPCTLPTTVPSPFLQLPITTWIATNDLALAIPAPLPVSPGHTLIVPRRLVASYFDATREEKTALWALVDEVKKALDEQLHPDGYEVTFTSGEVAKHAAPHAHVAIIPRFREPRQPPLATGGEHDPLSQHLWPLFSTATEIAIVAAFVTETGLELLDGWVAQALRAGAQLRVVTGDYCAFRST